MELVVLVDAAEGRSQIVRFFDEKPAGVVGQPCQAGPRVEADHVFDSLESHRQRLIYRRRTAAGLQQPFVDKFLHLPAGVGG